METKSNTENRKDISKKKVRRGNNSRKIMILAIIAFAVTTVLFTMIKTDVPKYKSKIDISVSQEQMVSIPGEKTDVDANTQAYIQDVFSKMLVYLKDNYQVDVKNTKAKLPKVVFAKFEDPSVIVQYNTVDRVLAIRKDAIKDKNAFTVATVHELLHFLSSNKENSLTGLIEEYNYKGKVYTIGLGLTEGITQKLTYEMCNSIIPGAIEKVYGSKEDLYEMEMKTAKVLELSVGRTTLYAGYFTGKTSKIKEVFNKKVIDKVGNVYQENPYFTLNGGMQTIVMDYHGKYDENLANTFLGIEEELVFSLNPSNYDEAKDILKVEDKYLKVKLSK